MKLRPNDLEMIQQILESQSSNPVKLIKLSEIMQQYLLNPEDAITCAGRMLQILPTLVAQYLLLDQRSIMTLVQRTQTELLDDGRLQMHFPRERPLEKFKPRSRWRPREAIEMKGLMTRFYESAFGLWASSETAMRSNLSEEYAHEAAFDCHRLWAKEDLLLVVAKDSYLDMLEAAAVTAPSGELNEDELLAPSGVLFFEHERNIPSLTAHNDDVPLRGIAWKVEGGFLSVQVLIDGHHELNNPGQLEPPADCYAYLYLMYLLKAPLRNPLIHGLENDVNALLGYLRSIKVIAQSPATNSSTVQTSPRSKKARKAAPGHQPEVRVLSLHHAEHGRYELDAATGRKVRQHWVRGHWRNQWYATLQDNRSIWIDGFIKGDSALGTVAGPKVHVAR